MTRAHAAAAHAPPPLFEAPGPAAASLPPSPFATAAVAALRRLIVLRVSGIVDARA